MALTDYVIMPSADYEALCDKTRELTGKTGKLTSSQLVSELANLKTGGTDVDVVYVTFMSHDGYRQLHKRAVVSGNDCMDIVTGGLIDSPVKESSNTEVYTFTGWSTSKNGTADVNALKNVTADRTVYATYTASTRYYTISYYDGESLLKTEKLAYGEMPSYTPQKEGFALTGWQPILSKVTSDAIYYAQWQEAEIVLYSGTCGDNATWIVNAAGTLRISGIGSTYDFTELTSSTNPAPWRAYNAQITTIEIGEGITRLGECLFPWMDATSVTLPDSLTTIAYRAFYYSKITSVTIPRNVTTVERRAFERCSNLTDMTVLCVASWGSEILFSTSNALVNLYVENWETWLQNDFNGYGESIPYYADNFYVNGELFEGGDFVIPDGITKIGSYTCYNLPITNVTIPASVKSIGKSAFAKYSGSISSVYYEGNLAEWISVELGDYNALGLGSGTSKLYIDGNLVEGDLVIPDGTTIIYPGAFYYQTKITSVTIPDSITTFDYSSFYGCTFNTVYYKGDLESWCRIERGAVVSQLDKAANKYFNGALLSGSNITIPTGVTEIPPYLLYKLTSVTSVTIPEGVTKIGEAAFYGCTGIKTITLPDSLTWINKEAFRNCTGIKTVAIPAAVNKISGYAFYGSGLTSITFKDTSGTWYRGKYSHSTTASSSNTLVSNITTLSNFTGSTYGSYYYTRAA